MEQAKRRDVLLLGRKTMSANDERSSAGRRERERERFAVAAGEAGQAASLPLSCG